MRRIQSRRLSTFKRRSNSCSKARSGTHPVSLKPSMGGVLVVMVMARSTWSAAGSSGNESQQVMAKAVNTDATFSDTPPSTGEAKGSVIMAVRIPRGPRASNLGWRNTDSCFQKLARYRMPIGQYCSLERSMNPSINYCPPSPAVSLAFLILMAGSPTLLTGAESSAEHASVQSHFAKLGTNKVHYL